MSESVVEVLEERMGLPPFPPEGEEEHRNEIASYQERDAHHRQD